MVTLPRLSALADKYLRRTGNGALLLFGRPRELPRNIGLLARYLWHVQIRRKGLVVLVRTGGLGDLICALASVPGLKDRYPNSWLVVICPPGCRRLAASSGLSDASDDDPWGFFHVFVNRMCSPSRYYHPVLPDECDPPRPQLLHLADEFASALRVVPDPASVRVTASKRVRRRMRRRLREINPHHYPLVVLHPGPSWPVREWPAPRWNELADLISAKTSAVMIKIGTDLDSSGQVRPGSPIPGVVDWVNKLDVLEITALLQEASAFVGINSGPLHIAATLGVPAVALFGAISGKLRLHPHTRAVIVTGDVGCLGCNHTPAGARHWRTGCPHDIACMQQIDAETVFAALVQVDGLSG